MIRTLSAALAAVLLCCAPALADTSVYSAGPQMAGSFTANDCLIARDTGTSLVIIDGGTCGSGGGTVTKSAVQSALGAYGPTAGSYGSGTAVATFTVDTHGLLTAAGSTTISILHSQISDWSSALAGYATLSGNETFTGTVAFSISPTVPTPAVGDASSKAANTQFVANGIALNQALALPGGPKAGRFFRPLGHPLGATFSSPNVIALMPFYVSASSTATSLSVLISTANASAWNARFGIYTDNGGSPTGGALVSGSDSGTVAVAANATGAVTSTISAALSPGWYWLAFLADTGGFGLQSLTTSNTTGINADLMNAMIGESTITVNNATGANISQTFGAMPSTLGTTAWNNVAATPMVWIGF